jgi:hypothetical protein
MRLAVLVFLVCVAIVSSPRRASAQTDEIQVYDGDLAPVGTFNLTWHNNYTPRGIATPAFPGAVVSDRSLNGTAEWAYGATPWFEAGLYLPVYSYDARRGATYDGFKLRTLFAVPRASERRFFYGVNFEFSVNEKAWDTQRFSSEVRPIVGWHLASWDVIVNPILDTEYDNLGNLDFAPSTRVAYNVSHAWAVSAEEYADYGPLRRLYGSAAQSHVLFGVVDYASRLVDVETGIGVGFTRASDDVTLKLILSKDLN